MVADTHAFRERWRLHFLPGARQVSRAYLAHTGLVFALAHSGIDMGDRSIPVHPLRHAISTAARTDVPAETVRTLLGDTSEAMTRRYDHPQLEDLLTRIEGAAPIIEEMFDEKHS
jgi:integrase